MNSDEMTGLAIFAGIWAAMAFTLAACMERQLKKVDRIIRLVEHDSKYVN